MELQDIFNKASEHLSAMSGPCLRNRSCVYRDGKGGMCAVGVFISDEHYTPEIESIGIADGNRGDLVRDIVARSLGLKALTRDQLRLFAALQDIHDEWDCDVRYGVEDDTLSDVDYSEVMEMNLENVRNRFDLEARS